MFEYRIFMPNSLYRSFYLSDSFLDKKQLNYCINEIEKKLLIASSINEITNLRNDINLITTINYLRYDQNKLSDYEEYILYAYLSKDPIYIMNTILIGFLFYNIELRDKLRELCEFLIINNDWLPIHNCVSLIHYDFFHEFINNEKYYIALGNNNTELLVNIMKSFAYLMIGIFTCNTIFLYESFKHDQRDFIAKLIKLYGDPLNFLNNYAKENNLDIEVIYGRFSNYFENSKLEKSTIDLAPYFKLKNNLSVYIPDKNLFKYLWS